MGMTENEAIARIKDQKRLCLQKGVIKVQGITEALEIGVNAIEKQIPKKAIGVKKYPNAINGKCPICERKMIKTYYCPTCGQRIDWSNEDD